jgi:cytochrome c peroxidase
MLPCRLLLLSLTLLALTACAPSPHDAEPTDDIELWKEATLRFQPLPDTAPNPENPVTEAKVALGKKLYSDAGLSRNNTVSCNSCHNLATFGVDNEPTSAGVGGARGERNSPTVLNAAFHRTQFWDGRAKDVEEQAGMPILNPVEMGIPTEEFLVNRLAAVDGYPALFADAFPEDDEPLTYHNITRALGAFERTLITPSRFDQYLRGDHSALTSQELSGLQTFIDIRCATCHNGVNVGAFTFQKFGLNENYWEHTGSDTIDEGRARVTGDESDRFFFKVAALRNVEKTGPYFHDGSVETLDEAIRVMVRIQLGLDLTDEEIANVVAFLKSLTGKVPAEAMRPTE